MELPDKLSNLNSGPKYLIINTTPLHPLKKTVAFNSIRTSSRKEDELFFELEGLAVGVLNSWKNDKKICYIAFASDRSLK